MFAGQAGRGVAVVPAFGGHRQDRLRGVFQAGQQAIELPVRYRPMCQQARAILANGTMIVTLVEAALMLSTMEAAAAVATAR